MKKEKQILTNVVSYTLGFRLLSMLVIAPFLSIYALNLRGGTASLTGLALGIFGFTQAILQIPFGILSDRIGFKKMMVAGLVMLIAGLVAASIAQGIYGLILSRALQGSGAIVTVGYSWISTETSGNERDKALVKVGTLIAAFSMLSYIIGPLVHIVMSIRQMFLFSAVLISFCLLAVLFFTKKVAPETKALAKQKTTKEKTTKEHILSSMLLTVNNLIGMSFFFMFSLLLKGILETSEMWIILVPAIVIAILLQKFLSKQAITGKAKPVLYSMFIFEGLAFIAMSQHKFWLIAIGTLLLMVGTFSISTIVPLIINRNNNKARGKSNGIMVSFQYLGSFLGAAITGVLWNWSQPFAFIFIILMAFSGVILVRINKKIA